MRLFLHGTKKHHINEEINAYIGKNWCVCDKTCFEIVQVNNYDNFKIATMFINWGLNIYGARNRVKLEFQLGER